MKKRRPPGKCVSLWMNAQQHREYRETCDRAELSGSHVVRHLLRAYRGGLVVPGLPVLGTSDASDKQTKP